MLRRLSLALISTVSALAFTQIASAADLPRKAPAYMPPPPPVLTWTGFYVGLNAGATWDAGNTTVSGTPGPCSAALAGCTSNPNYSQLMALGLNSLSFDNNNDARFIGGGQIGYNWQFTNWLAGIEADIQGVASNNGGFSSVTVIPSPAFPAFPITQTFDTEHKVEWLGTLRGRLGWLATPELLIYGTGGLAYGGVKSSTAITQRIAAPDPSIPASGFGESSETRAGWTAGGGLEWMFAPRWSVKAEYLYYDLGSVDYDIPLAIVSTAVPGAVTGSATAHVSQDFKGHIARVGINWHF